MSYSRRFTLIMGLILPLFTSACDINPGGRSQDTGIPDETAGGFLVEFDTSLAYSAITSFTDDLRDSNDCDSAYVHTIGWDQSSSTLPLFLYRTHYVSFGTCMGNRKKLISLLNSLRESDLVVNVKVDAVVRASNDAVQAYQLDQIKRNQACRSVKSDSDPIVVAVVDTGLDRSHPDLVNALYRDVSGKVIGANFFGKGISGNPDDNWDDDNGHGTHVAGIIAATGSQNPGVASCANVKIMPVRALGTKEGTGTSIELNRAVQWAAEHGADIINLSFGHLSSVSEVPVKFKSSLYSYLRDKGVIVFAAAGNDKIRANGSATSSGKFVYSFPSSYESVIGVAATGEDGKIASFSNYGKLIDIAAPGAKIVSTKMGGGYKSMSGTSMASPVAAASYAIALADLKSNLKQRPLSYKVGYSRALPLIRSSIVSRSLDNSQVISEGILSVPNLMSSMSSLAGAAASTSSFTEMQLTGDDSINFSTSTTQLGVSQVPVGTKQVYFYWRGHQLFVEIDNLYS